MSTKPSLPGSRTGTSRIAVGLFVLAVVVQVWSVYAPDSPAQPSFGGEDKIAHALLFGVPVALAWAGRIRPRIVTAVMVLHAPVSELVQHYVLPNRSGEVWDAVADLVGVLLGVLVGRALAGVVGRASSRW